MTHHQYGQVVGDEDTGGIVGNFVMMDDYSSVAIPTVSEAHPVAVVALAINGRVSRSKDTHGAVYLMSILDAGVLVKFISDAVDRLDSDDARADFRVGVVKGKDAIS